MALTNEDLKVLSDLLDEKLDKRLNPIEEKLDTIENRLDKVENRLDTIENRLDKVETRLDRLETDVTAVKKGLTEIRGAQIKFDRRISDIYNLALDAWGQGMENSAWLQKMTQ